MSAKSRFHNRHSSASTKNTVIKNIINAVNSITTQGTPSTHFESAQLQHLQIMIENLAGQVLNSMKHTKENQADEIQSKTTISLMRLYVQYLNLYMKFKNKCFSEDKPQLNIPLQYTANLFETPARKFEPTPQTTPHFKPVDNRQHPANDKQAQQIQESIQKIIHKNNPNSLQPVSPVKG